ncbi:Scr1 family TA system antitoxin-like transcriptional regulator [Amycolatopsis aidingensis]|uniref:Scr1 family TA system antitoxin-like transcriptional regulator n=1 Tax=Amycolatopsis aidingensis TaxID=2842453 RepID=UPI001C0B7C77|nr:Scr1 family TA system antitoxin-like transcriptional regulator [Amycolatopsis aidingensis]
MAAQLDHLITMSELPHVTIQVVPLDHGAMTGPLVLLSFPEEDEPDSAYAESVTGLGTVEKPEDVAGLSDLGSDSRHRASVPAVGGDHRECKGIEVSTHDH